jgi:hypothetical protein
VSLCGGSGARGGGPTHRLLIAASAARTLTDRLPQALAAAVMEFLTGDLLQAPSRVGKPLPRGLAGMWSARRGTYGPVRDRRRGPRPASSPHRPPRRRLSTAMTRRPVPRVVHPRAGDRARRQWSATRANGGYLDGHWHDAGGAPPQTSSWAAQPTSMRDVMFARVVRGQVKAGQVGQSLRLFNDEFVPALTAAQGFRRGLGDPRDRREFARCGRL